MSAIRVQKIFDSMLENLRRFEYTTITSDGRSEVTVWQGQDLASPISHDAVVWDLTSLGGTWTTGDLYAVLVAIEAGDGLPIAAFTQSHASGQIIQGGVKFQLWMETPASFTGAQKVFMDQLMQVIRGQMGAQVDLYLSANTVQPTVTGVNGAVATVGTFAASYLPWGMAVVGGI
jgi:hypothetical protein